MPNQGTGNNNSRSVEDFIKAVYVLQQALADDGERVSTNALKEALNITAPSVTDMARRLVESDLIDYTKYHGVRLTSSGERMALSILRRHRLIELYLVQELHYELAHVHDEADNLEHVVSERFIAAIAEKLGHPDFDPHGDPIPAADGSLPQRELYPLSELPLETTARVSRLISADNAMLQHTLDRGFTLDVTVEVKARDPFNGPLRVQVDGEETVIGHGVAACILVQVLDL